MIIPIIKVTYLLETRLASYSGSMGREKDSLVSVVCACA